MDITQDDLRLLSLFRAAWTGGPALREAEASLRATPGRAAGRVAGWSLTRAAEALRRGARRSLRIGGTLTPSADEQRLVLACRALAAGDDEAARETLRWLAAPGDAGRAAERLAPAACALYGYAAPRRQKAVSA